MDKKKKILKGVNEIEFVIGVVILAVMLFAAFFNIVARYILGHSQNWADELCRFGLIWVSFISMSAAVTSGNHLYVDLISTFTAKFPTFDIFIKTISSILWVAIGGFLGYWGIRSVLRVTEMTQTLGFSMKVVYFSIPLGCAFMVFRVIQVLVQNYKTFFKNKKGGVEE